MIIQPQNLILKIKLTVNNLIFRSLFLLTSIGTVRQLKINLQSTCFLIIFFSFLVTKIIIIIIIIIITKLQNDFVNLEVSYYNQIAIAN